MANFKLSTAKHTPNPPTPDMKGNLRFNRRQANVILRALQKDGIAALDRYKGKAHPNTLYVAQEWYNEWMRNQLSLHLG